MNFVASMCYNDFEVYSPEKIKEHVEKHADELFSSFAVNRPENWSYDRRTKDVICVGRWLDSELRDVGIVDLGRTQLLSQFNRRARSEEDIWSIAAQIMNDALVDNIDYFRRPHRRWG